MNKKQTQKTLGEILFDIINPDAVGGYHRLSVRRQGIYQSAVQAVISAATHGAEWVLLPKGILMDPKDMVWSHEYRTWMSPARTPVAEGDVAIRRIGITSVKLEEKLDHAEVYLKELGDERRRKEATLSPLPQPAETAGVGESQDMLVMLQSIITDLAEGKKVRSEFIAWVMGDVQTAYNAASERDQLRKELGVNNLRIDNLKDELRFRRQEVDNLIVENAALNELVKKQEKELSLLQGIYTIVAQERDASVAKLAAVQWTPVSERMPTEEDADEQGEVLQWIPNFGACVAKWYDIGNTIAWMRIPKFTPPLPQPETEEEKERKRFEEWAKPRNFDLTKRSDGLYKKDDTVIAWSAWQAAKKSTP